MFNINLLVHRITMKLPCKRRMLLRDVTVIRSKSRPIRRQSTLSINIYKIAMLKFLTSFCLR